MIRRLAIYCVTALFAAFTPTKVLAGDHCLVFGLSSGSTCPQMQPSDAASQIIEPKFFPNLTTELARVDTSQQRLFGEYTGDLAIVPSYNAANGRYSAVTVENKSAATQVVSFSLRRATDSAQSMNYKIVLAPGKAYAATVTSDTNGVYILDNAFGDNNPRAVQGVCTVPVRTFKRMPPGLALGASSGHIEVIAAAQALDESQPIAKSNLQGDCSSVSSNFFYVPGSADNAPLSGLRGVYGPDQSFQEDSVLGSVVENKFVNTESDALSVSWVNIDAALWNDNYALWPAIHVSGFTDLPMMTHQNTLAVDQSGQVTDKGRLLTSWLYPDLDGGPPGSLPQAPWHGRGLFSSKIVPLFVSPSGYEGEYRPSANSLLATEVAVTHLGQNVMRSPEYWTTTIDAQQIPHVVRYDLSGDTAVSGTISDISNSHYNLKIAPGLSHAGAELTYDISSSFSPRSGRINVRPETKNQTAGVWNPHTIGEVAPLAQRLYTATLVTFIDTSATPPRPVAFADSDGDGIQDLVDKCLATNVGATVDEVGCSSADYVLSDREVLVNLYSALQGESWSNAAGWLENSNFCSWSGVSCNAQGRVSNLSLFDNLEGELPTEFALLTALESLQIYSWGALTGELDISSLPNLTYVRIDAPQLRLTGDLARLQNLQTLRLNVEGAIPPDVTAIPNLTNLYLGQNLTGDLPSDFSALKSLETLEIRGGDQLVGTIDVSQLSAISNLRIDGAGLSLVGNIRDLVQLRNLNLNTPQSIPSDIGELTNLTALNLGSRLTGQIPNSLGNLTSLQSLSISAGQELLGVVPVSSLTNLGILNLYGDGISLPNDLSGLTNLWFLNLSLPGNIPTSLESVPSLESLSLGERFSGTVPPAIGRLTSLQSLSIRAGDALTGSVPVNSLTSLRDLSLYGSQITLPSGFSALTKLESLSLDLSGSVPKEIAALLNLQYLWLGSRFSGVLPQELGTLPSLVGLSISAGNDLVGTIPISNLSKLQSLYAWSGSGSGSLALPASISQLTALNNLTVNIGGKLPTDIGSLNQLTYLYIGSRVTGLLPSSIGNLSALTSLSIYAGEELRGILDLSNLNSLNSLNVSGANISLSTNLIGMKSIQNLYTNVNGTVPSGIRNLATLRSLSIGSRHTGTFPSDLSGLSALKSLSINGGQDLLGNVSLVGLSALESLTVSGANLSFSGDLTDLDSLLRLSLDVSGTLPTSIDKLSRLRSLYLGPNLSGALPASLGRLSNLEELQIYAGTALTGGFSASGMASLESLRIAGDNLELPTGLERLSSLKVLYLDLNDQIPSGIGSLKQINSLELGYRFTGEIPQAIADLTGLVALTINNGRLSGPLPDLGKLINLKTINIYGGSELTGILPEGIGNLVKLETLNISYTGLVGGIPSSYSALTNLRSLSLGYNKLSGGIPSYIGNWKALESLNLAGNQFSGGVPSQLANLTNLKFLNLSSNTFSGELPQTLFELTSLQSLYLSYNNFSGTLPAEIGELTNLTTLSLSGNQLAGSLPAELSNLRSITSLYLNQNNLSGNPWPVLNKLTSLRYLNLDNNELNGLMPDELGKLSQLSFLSIRNNALTGTLPRGLFDLTQLGSLRLSGNQLFGELPADIGKLSSLYSLDLSSNDFSGKIPKELGNISSLNTLNLRSNNFSGAIPAELGNLSQLSWGGLVLSDNKLTGSIPTELGKLSELRTLNLSGNALSGSISTAILDLPNLRYLWLENNQLTGRITDAQAESITGFWSYGLFGNLFSCPYPELLEQHFSRNGDKCQPTAPDAPVIERVDFDEGVITLVVKVPFNGGSAVTSYRATCSSGEEQVSETANNSTIVVRGLKPDVAYTCVVKATNVEGNSPASKPTDPVTPEFIPSGLPIWLLYEAGNSEASKGL